MTAVGGSLLVSAPSQATPSHPGDVPDTCPEVLSGRPTGGLEKVTEPAPGSTVGRGAVITVTLRWDPATFAGPALHKALDCVTVNGGAGDALSLQQRDPANSGEFTGRVAVPDDLADGTQLCDRGFVSGPGPGGTFVREKSNDVCFTVRGDSAPVPASPIAPQVALETAPAGSAAPAPAPAVTAPVSPPSPASSPSPALVPAPAVDTPVGPAPAPDEAVGPAGRGTPGTEVAGTTALADQPVSTLPRTGAPIMPVTVAGLGAIGVGLLARAAGRNRGRPSVRTDV